MNNKELQILIFEGNAATKIDSELAVIVTPEAAVFKAFENQASNMDLIVLIARLNSMSEYIFDSLKTKGSLSEDKINFYIRDIQAKIKNNEVEV